MDRWFCYGNHSYDHFQEGKSPEVKTKNYKINRGQTTISAMKPRSKGSASQLFNNRGQTTVSTDIKGVGIALVFAVIDLEVNSVQTPLNFIEYKTEADPFELLNCFF